MRDASFVPAATGRQRQATTAAHSPHRAVQNNVPIEYDHGLVNLSSFILPAKPLTSIARLCLHQIAFLCSWPDMRADLTLEYLRGWCRWQRYLCERDLARLCLEIDRNDTPGADRTFQQLPGQRVHDVALWGARGKKGQPM